MPMRQIRYFTEEQKAELLSNPYTFRVSDCRVYFSLSFKQFVMENIDKPGMNSTKVFRLAGYRDELFSHDYKKQIVKAIRKEAASPEGLKAPIPQNRYVEKKKHQATEIKELQERVAILEQQIDFLKKSQHLRETGQLIPPNSSE